MNLIPLLFILCGQVQAFDIRGGGDGVGVSQSDSDDRYLNTVGDTATGQINLTSATISGHISLATGTVTSTLTIQGNAFSIGTSTFVVTGSSVGIRTSNPRTALDVDGEFQAGYSASKSTITQTGAINLAINAALTLAGSGGTLASGSSVTASHIDSQSSNFTRSMTASTASIFGNAFSVGGSTFVVDSGTVNVAGYFSVGGGTFIVNASTVNVAGPYFSVGGTTLVTNNGRLGLGTATPLQQIHMTGNIRMPATTGATEGVIFRDGNRFLHNYPDISGVFLGDLAGNFSITGSRNVGIGRNVLTSLTSGSDNACLGTSSCDAITVGNNNNVFGGQDSLGLLVSGDDNTVVGNLSMPNLVSGGQNIAIGAVTMRFNQTGSSNTIGGYGSATGSSGNSFNGNSTWGYLSGQSLSTGSRNVLLGALAGDSLTYGWGNILIGFDVDATSAGSSSYINIGNTIYGNTVTGNVGIGAVVPGNKFQVSSGTVLIDGTAGGLQITSGTTITNIFKSSFTFDFPNVPAAGTISFGYSTTGIANGGAVARGDICWVEAEALEDDLSVDFSSATTSGAVLSLRFNNPSAGGIDPGLQLYRYGCMRSLN